MADGYIIEVTIPPTAGGKPTKAIWYAHIHDKKRALRAVRKASGADKGMAVEIIRAERHGILLERLGILEGEVRLS
jgi:hypothetical protein